MSRIVVQQGWAVVVRRDGVVTAVLGVGRHRLPRPWWRRRVDHVDLRETLLQVSGQELPAADVPGVKVSAAARWHVTDPVAFLDASTDPVEELRLQVQVAIRDWAAAAPLQELLAGRAAASSTLTPVVAAAVERLGVAVGEVLVRDLVVPGELRRAALAVATAQQEGLAALERARGETAALRAMSNGARVLAEHPGLLQLRTAQAAAAGGGTVVVQVVPRSEA